MSSSESSDNEIDVVKPLQRVQTSPDDNISAITVSSNDSGASNENSNDRLNFDLRSYVKENRSKQLWSIEFNNFLNDGQPKIFVALGGSQFSIYECLENGNIKLLMCFADPDANEDFYTCCWSINSVTNRSILLTGGQRGVIRIIEPEMENAETNAKHFIGHGEAVNQLKISPRKPFLLASASLDRSVRLWNIETHVCIATFHGVNGHRDGVITIDFNHDCTKLVSGGLDHLLAIWDLTTPKVAEAIRRSCDYNEKQQQRGFKTVLHSYPIFRSRQIHINYIDCVQWMNELIWSKSNCGDLFCWEPVLQSSNGKNVIKGQDQYRIIAELYIPNATYYYERFASDANTSLLALGMDDGDVHIWDLDTNDPTDFPVQILKHPKRKQIARHVSFSRDGTDLVICSDDGSIWYYYREQNNQLNVD